MCFFTFIDIINAIWYTNIGRMFTVSILYIKEVHMKKFTALLMAILICVLSISACNTNAVADEPARLLRDDVPDAPNLPTVYEVAPEYTSEGISVEIVDDNKSYHQNFSSIDIQVYRNDDSETVFYYYRYAYLQVLTEDGTWQNVSIIRNAIAYTINWLWSKDGQGFLTIKGDQIWGGLDVGRYRAIVFVGSDATPICDYFDITE